MSYNGWSNYETWKVNLEMLDAMTCGDFGVDPDGDDMDDARHDLADSLENYCTEMVEQLASGIALDLCMAFFVEVNWEEIADRMLEDYIADHF
jgi:hypothetical protein